MTGRPCDSASCCANSSRFSVPSTLTWCAAQRRELRARRQQRRQVEDEVDLELGQDALEQRRVEDRPDELALDQRRQRRVERREIERDDGARALGRQPLDQAVADSPPAPVMRTTGLRTAKLY